MTKEDYLISIFRKEDCKRLIRGELNSLPETATIRDAIIALQSQWTGYVCILDENKNLLGIIAERDILSCFGENKFTEDDSAKLIMDTNFKMIECRESIAEIALTLYKTTFKHLAIVEDGKLIGIVSARDFISYLVEYIAESVYTVSPSQPPQDQREGA
jgi:signal-transduction protein with cAMP-binding, CBS, and nucleotidyltransferase domain